MECNKCPKHDNGRFDPTPKPKPSPGCDCDFSDYYTKEQVDELINAIEGWQPVKVDVLPEVGDPKKIYLVPKEAEEGFDEYLYIDGKWELIGSAPFDVDLSNYYTKEEVDDLIPDVSGFATKTEVQTVDAKADLAMEKATELETSKQDKLRAGDNVTIVNNVISAVQPDISNLATKNELTSGLNTKQDKLTAGDNVTITNNVISAKDTTYSAGDNIEISPQNVIKANLTEYYKKSEVDTIVDSIVTGDYKKVDELPAVGENKVVYLVPKGDGEAPDYCDEYLYIDGQWELIGNSKVNLSDYATKAELATKQDKLTAGDNVTIANGVISATDTKYTAGNNITIANGQISATFTKAQLLEIMGYEEITISKTDSNGNTVTAKVLGYIE